MDGIQVFDNGVGGKLRAGADELGQLWFGKGQRYFIERYCGKAVA